MLDTVSEHEELDDKAQCDASISSCIATTELSEQKTAGDLCNEAYKDLELIWQSFVLPVGKPTSPPI